ncbi:MAG TPA: DUF1338 domain-containing protein [Candidatus Competibacteraceae bacterium]|nr:DUF1338 domain-containing protein [Candidatus Competibacteraceae bacterium]
MSQPRDSQLWQLLAACLGETRTAELLRMIFVHEALLTPPADRVPRVILAQAMNMVLFHGLVEAVPEGKVYVSERLAAGGQVLFDHGALRTVDAPDTGALPRGELAFKRILEPLGFAMAGLYPLARLKMTGRAYCHQDMPEEVAQFFVSELHAGQFSPAFQAAVARVVGSSRDPLDAQDKALLDKLAADRALPFVEAVALLPRLVGCFAVQHATPRLADYEILLAESAEMAWISTEGNCFNHATDRVADVFQLAEQQKALGRPMKERVEVSAAGSVRQTAYRATLVERSFLDAQGRLVTRTVPGSFYEFISRDRLADGRLDLRFDSGNAQGIFKMTAANAVEC